jgi:hypothetical protein
MNKNNVTLCMLYFLRCVVLLLVYHALNYYTIVFIDDI